MKTHRWYIIDKAENSIESGPFVFFADAAVSRSDRQLDPVRYGVFAGSYGEPGTLPEGYEPDVDLVRDMARGK